MSQFDLTDEQRQMEEKAQRFSANAIAPYAASRALAAALLRKDV